MKLPRFLANIVRAGNNPEIVTTRNFDEAASVLSDYANAIEGHETWIEKLERLINKVAISLNILRSYRYNVKDYGAKGDGVTVDTLAIQRAYDAAKAGVSVGSGTGGAVVYFPAGRYVSGALVFDSPFVSILGDGPTATELVATGSGTSFVKFYGGATVGGPKNFDCSLRDIKIIQSGVGPWTNLLHFENLSEMDVDFIWVEGSTTTCDYTVMLESALVMNFSKCTIRGAKYDAFRAMKRSGVGDAYPNAIAIGGSAIKRGSRWGIHYTDGEGFHVYDCDLSANGDTVDVNHGAIYINDAGGEVGAGPCAVIDTCRFEATSGVHVRIGQHGFGPGGTVINNCAAGGAMYGVYGVISGGQIGAVEMTRSSFVGSTAADYYFSSAFSVVAVRCQGITGTFPASAKLIPIPTGGSQSQISSDWTAYVPESITSNSATPSVSNYGQTKLLSNTAGTSITKFTGCKDGNFLVLYATNSNTILKHNASGLLAPDEMVLPGNADYAMVGGDSLILYRINNIWRAISQPQDLRLTASPQFVGLTLTGALAVGGNASFSQNVTLTTGTLALNALTAERIPFINTPDKELATSSALAWNVATSTLNLDGNTATATYRINAGGSIVSTGNSAAFIKFGLGQPSDLAAGNTEYVMLAHNGSSEAYISATKTGTGSYRPFRIYTSNTQQYECNASGAHKFASLAGTGSRIVEADSNGIVTAPDTLSNFIRRKSTDGITASTTQSQGQGALLSDHNVVSVCANANDTVTLPACASGMTIWIRNNGAQVLQIFPASGDAINGAAVNASVTLAAGAAVVYRTADATNWYT